MPLPSLAAIFIGLETMRVNPLRTALSTLGVIIGVGAMVSVLSLGDGMERLAREEIERTTDVQAVSIVPQQREEIGGVSIPRRDYPVFTIADASDLRSVPGVAGVSMVLTGGVIVTGGRGERRAASAAATVASHADFIAMRFAAGRFFTEVETTHDAAVIVLSNKLAAELAPDGHAEQMLGRQVRANGVPFAVIGVIASYKGERARSVIVPFRAARTLFGPADPPRAPTLLAKARSVESVGALQSAIQEWLANRYGRWERRVKVETSASRLEQTQRAMLTFKLFLGAITGISLVVGGIGIMNVLLASVTERTREIGVRRALGARRRDVLYQFLAESVAISGFGAGIGLALGITVTTVVTAIVRARTEAPLHAGFSLSSLLIVAVAAIGVGIVFGLYPALRAARLSPIEAIRHE